MAQGGTATATREGYRIQLPIPDDSDIETRNRPARLADLILSSVAMLAIPAGLLGWWGSFINPLCTSIGMFIGLVLGGLFASRIIPKRFLVNNPEWTAYVTQDAFGGEMVVYGPGLHPSHWWEERNEEGNISLEAIPLSFSVSISTGTAQITVNVNYEYARRLYAIRGAIGFDAEAIQEGVTPFIKTFLISQCTGNDENNKPKDAKWARTHVHELNIGLATEFMGIQTEHGETPNDFEESYGIISVSIAISSVAVPPAVQKSLDAIDEAASQLAIVAKVYGYGDDIAAMERDIRSGTITRSQYMEMLEHAMAVSENASMDIKVFRGNVPSAAASLAGDIKGDKS